MSSLNDYPLFSPNSRKAIGPTRSVGSMAMRLPPITALAATATASQPLPVKVALRLFGEKAKNEERFGELAKNNQFYIRRIICGHRVGGGSMRRERTTMKQPAYFHITANGADARHFIIRESEYFAAFNLIGVCAATCPGVIVVSFSIEDSHPHILVWGTREDCALFKDRFENLYKHYVAATRKGGADLVLHCELYPIGDDENYLLNVAVYTIIQPTKDGKPVMYHDYLWGTGSMYFRNGFYTPVWYFDKKGAIRQPERFGDQDSVTKRLLLHSRSLTIPDGWLVCNGFILPSNYIDIPRFESIYGTHNRFRVFLSSPRKREEEMLRRMSEQRGVMLEDLEDRKVCGDVCKKLYGTRDPRRLDATQRIALAQELRRIYRMTFRQLATVVRLPETEIQAYVRH